MQSKRIRLLSILAQYNLVSWYLNALGAPLEAGVAGHAMQGK